MLKAVEVLLSERALPYVRFDGMPHAAFHEPPARKAR